MPAQLNRLEQVAATHAGIADDTVCPICLMSVREEIRTHDQQQSNDNENDNGSTSNGAGAGEDTRIRELLKHASCRTIYHADCIEHWLEDNRTCPLCRKRLVRANHDEDLHMEMIESTRQRLASSDQWIHYWQQRSMRQIELGTELFNQQPGYPAQEQFRNAILKLRIDHTQSLHRAIQTLYWVTSTGDTTDEDNISHPFSDPDEIERNHISVETVAQWNLLTAGHELDPTRSAEFETAWHESHVRLQAGVQDARAVLRHEREMDTDTSLWEADPPNPFG